MASTRTSYSLPFSKQIQIFAKSDPRAHFGPFKYAIDFILPEGSIICAPKAGIVTELKTDSKKGGLDPKYSDEKYLNYMTIKHHTNEFSQYLHLKYRGELVKVGAKVKEGSPIALSGNTGLSSTPHLHFQVFKLNKTNVGFETLKIKFKEKIRIERRQRAVPESMNRMLEHLENKKELMK